MTYTHAYLATLARRMVDTDATAEEVAYAVEKPWKHAEELPPSADMLAAQPVAPAPDRDALWSALAAPDACLAEHLRDARSTENPCQHWSGQQIAVCSPCLRDRLIPHIIAALAARPAPSGDTDLAARVQALREDAAAVVALDATGDWDRAWRQAHRKFMGRLDALLADQPAATPEGTESDR